MHIKPLIAYQFLVQAKQPTANDQTSETAGYILLLPGRELDISALNTAHKFRGRGNKEGAVAATTELEAAGLDVVKTEKATCGCAKVHYTLIYIKGLFIL